jgi:hypothetical protein
MKEFTTAEVLRKDKLAARKMEKKKSIGQIANEPLPKKEEDGKEDDVHDDQI